MRRQVLVLILALVGGGAQASPAAAHPDIGISLDGITWSEGLTQPLFDPRVRWVPGDSRTATVFVRNQASEAAGLSVDVLGARVDALLETGHLTISARAGHGPWQAVSGGGTQRLLSTVASDIREVTRLNVRVGFDESSRNRSQTLKLDLELRVRLTEDLAAGGTNRPESGLLPDTGGPATWLLMTGLALVAGGITATRRRQEKEDSHVHS